MATEKFQVYKCDICGIIAEVLDGGAGEMSCCHEPMRLLKEKTEDAGNEKHVPVVEEAGEGVKVKVGSVAHPMEEKHFIQWVEVIAGERVLRRFLAPGEAPEATFEVKAGDIDTVREHCTLHGLWRS